MALSCAGFDITPWEWGCLTQGRQLKPQGLLLEREELTAHTDAILMTQNLIASYENPTVIMKVLTYQVTGPPRS
jgi:hypothetical protein